MPDGHWVWCDWYGGGGGDNIALVQSEQPDTTFTEAIFQLSGGAVTTVARRDERTERQVELPRVPRQTAQDLDQGRAYLMGRWISLETLEAAEKQGFLRYTRDGVLYCGRDGDGRIRAATVRSTDPAADRPRRDLRHTDERFPPILSGNPREVHVVEGGADALAVHDRAREIGREPPTVIVTGGVGVRKGLQAEHVRQLLAGAERVTLWMERESHVERQAQTDAARDRQEQLIREAAPGAQVRRQEPAEGAKDAAEALEVVRAREHEAEIERQEAMTQSANGIEFNN